MNVSKSHKRLKETVTRPSGLLNNWESRDISRGGRTGKTPTPQEGSVLPPSDVLGGLADEDADSERPSSKASKGQDVTRKNEVNSWVHVCRTLG